MLTVEVKIVDDDGVETVHHLPASYEVCGRCHGHGTHLHPAIGEQAYSMEEFEREYPDDESRENYLRRGGIYDVPCEKCKGQRVVAVVDRDACTTPEEIEGLKVFDRQRRADAEHEQLVRSELAFGC